MVRATVGFPIPAIPVFPATVDELKQNDITVLAIGLHGHIKASCPALAFTLAHSVLDAQFG